MAKQQNGSSSNTNPSSFLMNDESLHDSSTHDYYHDFSSHDYYEDSSNRNFFLHHDETHNEPFSRNHLWAFIAALTAVVLVVLFFLLFGGQKNTATTTPINNSIKIDNGTRHYHPNHPRRGGRSGNTQSSYSDGYMKTVAENTGKANGYLQEIAENTNRTNQKLDGIQSEVSGLRSDVSNLRSDMNAGFSRNHQDLVIIQNQVTSLGQLGTYIPKQGKTYWDGGNKKSSGNGWQE